MKLHCGSSESNSGLVTLVALFGSLPLYHFLGFSTVLFGLEWPDGHSRCQPCDMALFVSPLSVMDLGR